MNIKIREVLVLDGQHAIFLTDEDVKEFNNAASCRNDGKHVPMSIDDVLMFLVHNIDIYYEGKKWGFNDTCVREDLCAVLERYAS